MTINKAGQYISMVGEPGKLAIIASFVMHKRPLLVERSTEIKKTLLIILQTNIDMLEETPSVEP